MADTDQLRVRLVSPDRILVDQTATAVEVPSSSGYIEVLFGHAPLLAAIGAGEVRLHGGESDGQRYFVARGFVEVLPERVTILAEVAEKPEEIDSGEAQKELQHGQELWNDAGEEAEKYDQANQVIAEAESKLASSGRSAAGSHS
ncbi:ATP synthase F1 subunit epsilon [Paracidobacterium acidisoli]|uniref:ATP synthase epsilon chain n=1 Tax=Paracidobacterium acidisoli TaxID=2303751 RepID=A0A372IKN6_9BACT|nr:ATP synthase F1 subunit epsilon [Paracidobacterium acidisoli]MBT9332829.1 ATP synthase F1 subunit epsilon [Paracidobacterium acidisoli]